MSKQQTQSFTSKFQKGYNTLQQNFKYILFSILLSFVLISGFAQNGNNPFELMPRLKESPIQKNNETKLNTNKSTDNPFELERQTAESETKETTEESSKEVKPDNPTNQSTTITSPNEQNPFEVETSNNQNFNTIKTEENAELATEEKKAFSESNNPFDLVAPSSEQEEQPPKQVTINTPQAEKSTPLPKIAKKIKKNKSRQEKTQQRFLAPVVMIMLAILALLITLFRSVLTKTYQAFLNDNILSILYRERSSILISPYTILYIMFLMNTSIFIFLLSEYYELYISNSRFWSLMLSIGLVFAIFLFKHLVLRLLAFIFPITKEVKLYNFTIIIFGIIVGMLLVPANILIAYAPPGLTNSLVYIALAVMGLIYLFRSLRGLFIANRFLLFHKFHFLLYICTVEIAPIIIFLKLIS